MTDPRPARLCRSWLFVNGAEEAALASAPQSGADVLIHELEDFTPPRLRPKARLLAPEVYAAWRNAGATVAVRVNPLEGEGMEDLAAVMLGRPDIVALPKVAEPEHVEHLAIAVTGFEREYGIPEGATRLLPNIELARGILQIGAIAKASRRTEALLMASEDLAADLGAERGRDGIEIAYARQRFLLECVAAGVVAVDCPYTWIDAAGLERDAIWARRIGYKAKSAVAASHPDIINKVLTPQPADVIRAQAIISAFESGQAEGVARVELDGALVEAPVYHTARRVLARAVELGVA